MTMKIFGAAMIISGGYLLGRVSTLQKKKRVAGLKAFTDGLKGYENALSEYRLSPNEYFGGLGPFGKSILAGEHIEGLVKEDEARIFSLMERLKSASFHQALELVRKDLSDQIALISALEEEVQTAGKALPLVSGAIGFLVAVFLL